LAREGKKVMQFLSEGRLPAKTWATACEGAKKKVSATLTKNAYLDREQERRKEIPQA
jgi:hypothetical protein